MSNAQVSFAPLSNPSREAEAGAEQVFWFKCPKWGHRCGFLLIAGKTDFRREGQGKNGGRPQWDWDGNRANPTFKPSVNCHGCWHGYIRKGRCVNTSGQDEPEPKEKAS